MPQIAGQDIRARTSVHTVRTIPPRKVVIPRAPADGVIPGTAQQAVMPTLAQQHVIPVAPIRRIFPVPAKQPIRAEATAQAVISGPPRQAVIPALARQNVIPVAAIQRIDTLAAKKLVRTSPARQAVIPASADQPVIPRIPNQPVIPVAPVKAVRAIPAIEHVPPLAPEQVIRPGTAEEAVISHSAKQAVSPGASDKAVISTPTVLGARVTATGATAARPSATTAGAIAATTRITTAAATAATTAGASAATTRITTAAATTSATATRPGTTPTRAAAAIAPGSIWQGRRFGHQDAVHLGKVHLAQFGNCQTAPRSGADLQLLGPETQDRPRRRRRHHQLPRVAKEGPSRQVDPVLPRLEPDDHIALAIRPHHEKIRPHSARQDIRARPVNHHIAPRPACRAHHAQRGQRHDKLGQPHLRPGQGKDHQLSLHHHAAQCGDPGQGHVAAIRQRRQMRKPPPRQQRKDRQPSIRPRRDDKGPAGMLHHLQHRRPVEPRRQPVDHLIDRYQPPVRTDGKDRQAGRAGRCCDQPMATMGRHNLQGCRRVERHAFGHPRLPDPRQGPCRRQGQDGNPILARRGRKDKGCPPDHRPGQRRHPRQRHIARIRHHTAALQGAIRTCAKGLYPAAITARGQKEGLPARPQRHHLHRLPLQGRRRCQIAGEGPPLFGTRGGDKVIRQAARHAPDRDRHPRLLHEARHRHPARRDRQRHRLVLHRIEDAQHRGRPAGQPHLSPRERLRETRAKGHSNP